MTAAQPDPSSLIKVELSVGHPTYLTLAAILHGEDSEKWWKELGDQLYGRPGWYCEVVHRNRGVEMMWSFGPVGASLFNISYDGQPDYAVFDFEKDLTPRFQTINELRRWLDENDGRHADHTRNLRGLASSSDWGVLKTFGFHIDMTFDKDMWIGTVRTLPMAMSAAEFLVDAVSQNREAIAQAFDAPALVAKDIQVQVHLDSVAASALSS